VTAPPVIAPPVATPPAASPAPVDVAAAVSAEPAVDAQPAAPPEPAPVLPSLPAAPLAVSPGKDVTMSFDTISAEKNPADKAQALFSDLNDRAKGAMEKGAAMFEDVSAFNKGNIEAVVESSKLAAKSVETLGHDVAAYAKTSFESATDAMKTLATAKSPTEFMKLQSDYARTAFDTLIADSARSTEMMMKMMGEITQPISNRVAVATNKLKLSA